jgi:hypothetical protein
MSAFKIPNWRAEKALEKVELPPELPPDLLELPAIEPTAPKRLQYMAKGGRWSFDRHLQNLPRHGVGELHRAIHSAVLAGLAEGQNSAAIHYLVRETAMSRGRPRHQADQEVRSSLINAHRWLSGVETDVDSSRSMIPRDTKTDWSRVGTLVTGEHTLEALRGCSGEIPADTRSVLSATFSGDELICCGTEMNNARTQSLAEWLAEDVSSQRLVVPNPMTKPMGINQQGRASARCLDNTGPRRFLVVEFDFAKGKSTECDSIINEMESLGRNTADMNAALHAHLQEFLPLGIVVYSGGKSLHGWYPCKGLSEEEQGQFLKYALRLGADPMLFTSCQLARMPWGIRDNGKVQEVVYFNGEVMSHAR